MLIILVFGRRVLAEIRVPSLSDKNNKVLK